MQGCKVTRGKGNDCVPCVYYGTEYLSSKQATKPVALLYSRGNNYDLLVKWWRRSCDREEVMYDHSGEHESARAERGTM